jgi:phosphate transport system protein
MENHPRHTNLQFEAELNGLREALLKMGALVQVQIARAIEALVNRDSAKARETIARDLEVNHLDIEMDERCIRLLALYQPAASDLRLITTGLKITTDLERIGDNAVNICERVLEFNQHPLPTAYIDIPRMAAVAQSMVQDSLDAFTRGDAALAEQVIARDDEVDSLNDQVYRQLLALMAEDSQTIPRATPILFVAKYLERIADHATNIAEMAVFLIKGRDIRHMDKRQQTSQEVR